ncbi:MAG: ABC transporter permease [Clostridiales bacterium]|nr:ABC transporter permease [Clostridiales bacterium]
MGKYILRRLVMCVIVVFVAAIIIFTIMYFVPGDPVEIMLGSTATVEQKDALRASLGLDQPFLIQLGTYLLNLLQGDFGTSYTYNAPVTNELLSRLPYTLLIGISGIIVDVIISIPLGIYAALRRGKWQDTACTVFAMACVSVPDFWFALMLVVIFAVNLQVLPVSGIGGPRYFVMPIAASALAGIGGLLRQTRSGMLDVMNSDFVVTARSKGVPEGKVILQHMLPNALIPVVTVVGGHFSRCIGGAVIIEQIFSIPGLGAYMLNAINTRDYPVIRSSVVILAAVTSIVMLVVDIVYALIDPRIKAQYSGK